MASMSVERSIWIAASRERVWDAITNPEQVGAWFSPGTHWRSTGVKVGGTLSVYDPETNSDLFTQVIEVVDAPSQLVTRAADAPFTTTWLLAEEKSGTRLTLIYAGYEHLPEGERQPSMDENSGGFGMMLENLKAQVEGESLPYPQGF